MDDRGNKLVGNHVNGDRAPRSGLFIWKFAVFDTPRHSDERIEALLAYASPERRSHDGDPESEN